MALGALDRQLLLIQQIGDVDPVTAEPILPVTPGSSGIVIQNAERLWNANVERLTLPFLGQQLFDYYFKRDAVALIIGVLESRVDFSAVGTAMSVKLNQRIQARVMQSERYKAEIVRLEARLAQLVPPLVGALTSIEPITPPLPGSNSSPTGETFTPDASDPRYQGSPYWPISTDPSMRR